MSVLYTHIHRETYTVERARACVALLERVLTKALYTDDQEAVTVRYEAVLAELSAETPELIPIVQRFGTEWLSGITMETLAGTMRDLEAEVAAAPTLKVYVPVALDVPAERLLGEWLRAELPQVAFFDTEIDTAFVGGCGIVVNGQLHDYSLAARLKANPTVVREAIQTYVNS